MNAFKKAWEIGKSIPTPTVLGLLKAMYDLPSQDNVEEVIIDTPAVKGQSQPIIVHSKTNIKNKTDKTSAE